MMNTNRSGDRGSKNEAARTLNRSDNVLLVYRLEEMKSSASLNFVLAVLCLVYCGINATLLVVNYANSRRDDRRDEDAKPVSDNVFHLLEFWATFGFAVVECISLASTPKSLLGIYSNPLFLKILLFFNILATLIPALLVTMNLEDFETLSHEIEYLNELTMSLVDLIILGSLCNWQSSGVLTTLLACLIAVIQLTVYNLLGRQEDGSMVGEVPAHYCEFAFEILSSLIAFWFCMDNKFVADEEIGMILYGKHRDCRLCDAKSVEFSQTYITAAIVPSMDSHLRSSTATNYGTV